jgi:hypothetical protein
MGGRHQIPNFKANRSELQTPNRPRLKPQQQKNPHSGGVFDISSQRQNDVVVIEVVLRERVSNRSPCYQGSLQGFRHSGERIRKPMALKAMPRLRCQRLHRVEGEKIVGE